MTCTPTKVFIDLFKGNLHPRIELGHDVESFLWTLLRVLLKYFRTAAADEDPDGIIARDYSRLFRDHRSTSAMHVMYRRIEFLMGDKDIFLILMRCDGVDVGEMVGLRAVLITTMFTLSEYWDRTPLFDDPRLPQMTGPPPLPTYDTFMSNLSGSPSHIRFCCRKGEEKQVLDQAKA